MDKVREALETARRRLVTAARFAGNDDDVAEASVSFIDATLASLPASDAGGWRPIESAPKDGTRVLVLLRSDLPEHSKHFNGVTFVAHHPGRPVDGFDIGWCFSAPVGMGGFPDEWFVGWRPLPTPPRSLPTGGDDA